MKIRSGRSTSRSINWTGRTQQNTAMVEETAAAAYSLTEEAQKLAQTIGKICVGRGGVKTSVPSKLASLGVTSLRPTKSVAMP